MAIRYLTLFLFICLNVVYGFNSSESELLTFNNKIIYSDSVTPKGSSLLSPKSLRKEKYIPLLRGSSWLDALGEGNACLDTSGKIGACLSFQRCFPQIRYPISNIFNPWFVGNYDSCNYFTPDGFQAFGICCTNSQQIPDESVENNKVDEDDGNKRVEISQWPPPVPTHPTQVPDHHPTMQWPPPIPTHPPGHHAPTHPPLPTHPTHPSQDHTSTPWWMSSTTTTTTSTTTTPKTTTVPWWVTTTTTTRRPWTTTTRRPWTTTTTKRPAWPPQAPTHPPSIPVPAQPENEGADSGGFPPNCGAKNGILQDQERIVGGQTASPNEFPWMVVLFNGARQFCGGSLIDNVHILTAAHCVAQMTSWDVARVSAHIGDHDIRNPNEVPHITRRIKRVVRHRGFDFSHLHNDVAILTMDQPVKFTRNISPICLPPSSSGKLYQGALATVVGWGSLRENGPQPSVLQKVTIPIWSNNDCSQKYGSAAPAGIASSMICAGQATKDSCSGDSGGPLMINEGGRWTQAGIVSWGIGCGKGQYPGVYTRVSSFLPWIEKNLKP